MYISGFYEKTSIFALENKFFPENIQKICDFCLFSWKIRVSDRKLKKRVYPHHLNPVIAINPIFGQDRLLGGYKNVMREFSNFCRFHPFLVPFLPKNWENDQFWPFSGQNGGKSAKIRKFPHNVFITPLGAYLGQKWGL